MGVPQWDRGQLLPPRKKNTCVPVALEAFKEVKEQKNTLTLWDHQHTQNHKILYILRDGTDLESHTKALRCLDCHRK